jgi:hypothetical protein
VGQPRAISGLELQRIYSGQHLSTIIFMQTVAATPCTASHKFVVQGRPRREVLCIMLPRVVHDGHSGLCISQNFLRYATLVADVDPPYHCRCRLGA